MTLDEALTGILVTPYDGNGDIAPERLAPIVDRAAGLHMPVVNGNTGEFYALTTAHLVEEIAEECTGMESFEDFVLEQVAGGATSWFPIGRRHCRTHVSAVTCARPRPVGGSG